MKSLNSAKAAEARGQRRLTWNELREQVWSELGETFFVCPDKILSFIARSWRELMPDRSPSPFRRGEARGSPLTSSLKRQLSADTRSIKTGETSPDFGAVTQQFLWQVLEHDAETAAVLLWLTLTEWLTGWQESEGAGLAQHRL